MSRAPGITKGGKAISEFNEFMADMENIGPPPILTSWPGDKFPTSDTDSVLGDVFRLLMELEVGNEAQCGFIVLELSDEFDITRKEVQ